MQDVGAEMPHPRAAGVVCPMPAKRQRAENEARQQAADATEEEPPRVTPGQTAKQQEAREHDLYGEAELPQATEPGGGENRADQLAGEGRAERGSAHAGGDDPQPEEPAQQSQPHAPGRQTQQKTLELPGFFGPAAGCPPGRLRHRQQKSKTPERRHDRGVMRAAD